MQCVFSCFLFSSERQPHSFLPLSLANPRTTCGSDASRHHPRHTSSLPLVLLAKTKQPQFVTNMHCVWKWFASSLWLKDVWSGEVWQQPKHLRATVEGSSEQQTPHNIFLICWTTCSIFISIFISTTNVFVTHPITMLETWTRPSIKIACACELFEDKEHQNTTNKKVTKSKSQQTQHNELNKHKRQENSNFKNERQSSKWHQWRQQHQRDDIGLVFAQAHLSQLLFVVVPRVLCRCPFEQTITENAWMCFTTTIQLRTKEISRSQIIDACFCQKRAMTRWVSGQKQKWTGEVSGFALGRSQKTTTGELDEHSNDVDAVEWKQTWLDCPWTRRQKQADVNFLWIDNLAGGIETAPNRP